MSRILLVRHKHHTRPTITIQRPLPARMLTSTSIQPSAGADPEVLAQQASALVDAGRWTLCNDGKGLEREFRFRTFKAAWEFMNIVAAECKKQKHHPEWTNVYNRTHVRWTTHRPEGLSAKDTLMARLCDDAGREAGEVVEEEGEGKGVGESAGGRIEAGDCCKPKGDL